MLARHHNLAITPEQRLAFVTLLSRAADDVGLRSDREFRAAIMGYTEWGTRLAMQNSQPGAQTVAHAPVRGRRSGWLGRQRTTRNVARRAAETLPARSVAVARAR
jgi:hemoglobin